MRRVRRTVVAVVALGAALSLWSLGSAATSAAFSSNADNASNSLAAASSFYRAEVMSDGPVGYWRLGESSGTTAADETGTSNGTYIGAYTLGRPGALAHDANTAVELDGANARVGVAHVSALNLTSQVSIEAWVKPDSVSGTRYIVHKNTFYYLYVANNVTYFGIRSGGAYKYVQATGLITTGTWQHIVGTYDGAKMILYRNGVNSAEVAVTGSIDTTTVNLRIGAFDAAANVFDGSLDEVAVYNRALTAGEVQAHYGRAV